jgi:predicted transcriptional regulator
MAMDPVRKALRVTLRDLPVSIRQLARVAGLPHSTLVLVRDGKLNLSPAATAKVVRALREMSDGLAESAERIEDAARERGNSL